jgi:hypothetical protein
MLAFMIFMALMKLGADQIATAQDLITLIR